MFLPNNACVLEVTYMLFQLPYASFNEKSKSI